MNFSRFVKYIAIAWSAMIIIGGYMNLMHPYTDPTNVRALGALVLLAGIMIIVREIGHAD